MFNTINIITFLPYFTKFIALSIRDVLWLRIILIVAECGLFVRSSFFLDPPNYHVAFWNIVFILVNIYHIAVIIYEKRPVKMSTKEKELHETMFRGLSPVEFLKITKVAEWKEFKSPLPIIQQGKPVKDLVLIYNGLVHVIVNDKKVAELKDGQFVGEMSFLTEKPATATCKVEHNAECLVWNQKDFKDLLKRNPSLYFTIQSLLSEQVSNNLVTSSQK